MRNFIRDIKCWANKYKVHSALLMLFISGALFSLALTTWWFGVGWDNRAAAYDRQVARLTADVDAERANREELKALAAQAQRNADQTERNADDIAKLLKLAEEAVAKATGASTTAKGAATTARAAARNAAKSAAQNQIRIIEVAPRKGLKADK